MLPLVLVAVLLGATALDERATLVVEVVSADTGEPLAGVPVLAWTIPPGDAGIAIGDESVGTEERAPSTDAEGRATLRLRPGRALRISPTPRDGVAPDDERILEPFEPREERSLRFELPTVPDLVYRARVVDRHGEPVQGARVRVAAGELMWTMTVVARTVTERDGTFELRLRSWHADRATVEADGFGPLGFVPIRGHATEQTERTHVLDRTASLVGRVADAAGDGLADVEVRVIDAEGELGLDPWTALGDVVVEPTRTDTNGAYRFDDLPPHRPFDVALFRDADLLRASADVVRLEPGETRAIDWQIGGGASVSGIVALAGPDVPLRPRRIVLRSRRGAVCASARTLVNSAFLFEDVPDGEWIVALSEDIDDVAAPERLVRVERGRADGDVRLELRRRHAAVCGRVLDAQGAPVARALVTAASSELPSVSARCWSSEDGSFTLTSLVQGPVRIDAHATEGRWSGRLESPSDDVEVRVQPRARVEARVVDARTGEPRRAYVAAGSQYPRDAAAETDWRGRVRLTQLPPGSCTVVATTPGGLVGRATVELVGGETSAATVAVGPGAALDVRRDHDGAWIVVDLESDGVLWERRVLPGRGVARLFASPGAATVTFLAPSESPEQEPRRIGRQRVRLALGEPALVVAPR